MPECNNIEDSRPCKVKQTHSSGLFCDPLCESSCGGPPCPTGGLFCGPPCPPGTVPKQNACRDNSPCKLYCGSKWTCGPNISPCESPYGGPPCPIGGPSCGPPCLLGAPPAQNESCGPYNLSCGSSCCGPPCPTGGLYCGPPCPPGTVPRQR